MITEIDKETLNFISKKKLTFNQFCVCLLLYNKDFTAMQQYTHEIGYLTGGSYIKPNRDEVNEVEDLLARGFIIHEGRDKKNYYDLDNFTVTDKFTKGFIDKYEEACDEFWKLYPNNFFINGKESPTAKVMDYEEFKKVYINIIKSDFSLHSNIIGKIRIALSNSKYATMKISNYLASKQWENEVGTEQKIRIR